MFAPYIYMRERVYILRVTSVAKTLPCPSVVFGAKGYPIRGVTTIDYHPANNRQK